MRAIVLTQTNTYPQYEEEYTDPMVQRDVGVMVDLHYAGLNRRDYWITQGRYPNISLPVILGSDGMGFVDGRRVLIYPGSGWGDDKHAQGDDFKILGMPQDGTLAERVVVDSSQLFDAPEYLTDAEAGCVGLAGLTAYRALFTQGRLKGADRVLITGIGGGVAMMACMMAVAAGAEVHVTSGSDEKLHHAMKWGVKAGYNYRVDEWTKSLRSQGISFDLIVDSAGGSSYQELIKTAAPGGRIVNYGATLGSPDQLPLSIVFWRQLQLIGSTMGTPREFGDMLDFISKYQIRPLIHKLYYWHQVDEAFDTLRDSKQMGKLVFSLK